MPITISAQLWIDCEQNRHHHHTRTDLMLSHEYKLNYSDPMFGNMKAVLVVTFGSVQIYLENKYSKIRQLNCFEYHTKGT